MLTREQHDLISDGLADFGFTVEPWNPKGSDVIDVWSKDETKGFIELTVCHASDDYIVFTRPIYEDEGLIECLNGDVFELAGSLGAFFNY